MQGRVDGKTKQVPWHVRHVHPELLLVFTLRDVRERLDRRHPYQLIRIGGLLRHLLLDGQPLLVQANRETKLKIEFRTMNLGARGGSVAADGSVPVWDTVVAPTLADIDAPHVDAVPLVTFLATPLFGTKSGEFTVRDAIRQAAHIQGGVHSGTPRSDAEKIQMQASHADSMTMPVWSQGLIQVALIVLRALDPLAKQLEEKWGIPGGASAPV